MTTDESQSACWGRVERAYEDLFGDNLIALALMGSSVTGEITPGWSDLDVAVFLAPRAFDADGLSLDLVRGAQRLAESIDVLSAGYAFLSPTFLNPDRPPANWAGLLPGTYNTLRGAIPAGAEATPKACRTFAIGHLSRAGRLYERETLRFAGLHDYGVSGKDIVSWLRSIRNGVKYLMLSTIAVYSDDFTSVWSMVKSSAVDAFRQTGAASDDDLGRFYSIIGSHPPSPHNVGAMREASIHALRFIGSCARFAREEGISAA